MQIIMNQNRFKNSFPMIYWFISHPGVSFVTALIAAIAASFYSAHISLSIVCAYYLLLTYYFERRHLNFLLMTPITIYSFVEFMRLGIAPVFLVFLNGGVLDYYILDMQIAHVLTFPLVIGAYQFINRREPAFSLPDASTNASQPFYKSMKMSGWLCLSYTCIMLFVGAKTGDLDRGDAGATASLFDVFALFIRITDMTFFLLPLVIVRSNHTKRICIYAILMVIFVFYFATGTRGFIFFSGFYLICGYWLVNGSGKVIKRAGVFLFIMMLFLIPFMAAYRSTSSFMETSLTDVGARLGTVKSVKEELGADAFDLSNNLSMIYKSLLGVSDPIIYELVPSDVPYAGWEGISAVLYAWIPKGVWKDKPLLLDGNEVVAAYSGVYQERSFSTITFNADMYRRFGWKGIFIGNLIYGIFFGYFSRYIFRLYHKNAILGFLFLAYSVSWFRGFPRGTMLTTFWYFLWETPKYVLLLMVLYSIVKHYTAREKTFDTIQHK